VFLETFSALQACNRMSYECVPLYDTLGENAVEFIINHSEAVVTVVDGRKLGSLAGAVKGINTAQFKNVVYWGQEDAAAVQVGASGRLGSSVWGKGSSTTSVVLVVFRACVLHG
jgi:long-subunit acyl-CoA synthetase (AMP-forming)